eukprot:TRINITY_DN1574_c0_g1_i1.p1 TRINITY_DN1574_c0_g1~~TRINITY_DN1574_c0_g1_i1.p1  ORF type:complete len:338 (+),score=70.55 TRINITY_DN1574_c0_g1_i1:49-1062(+)
MSEERSDTAVWSPLGMSGRDGADFRLSNHCREKFIEEMEELCEMMDKNVRRGNLYVRWMQRCLGLHDCRVLVDAAEIAMRLQQEAGLGAIVAEDPFEIPALVARLAGAVSTFCVTNKVAPPPAVLDLVITGSILPTMHLRSRARDAMSDHLLESVDNLLHLSIYVLTHLFHHTEDTSEHVSDNTERYIEETVSVLLDVLNDSCEETVHHAVHILVFLQTFSTTKTMYKTIQEHRHANKFGTGFISLINRGAFSNGVDDDLVDVSFAQMMLKIEAVNPTSVLYRGDVSVLTEILAREMRDTPTDSPRRPAYHALLHTIATSTLRPTDCSTDLTPFEQP